MKSPGIFNVTSPVERSTAFFSVEAVADKSVQALQRLPEKNWSSPCKGEQKNS